MDNKHVLSHITLAVTDLGIMKTFYSEFGFTLYSHSEDSHHPFVMFKFASLILALYPKHLLSEIAAVSMDDFTSNNAMSLSLNVSSKESVDYHLAKAKYLNAKVTREGFVPAWGGYCAYFKDPENNLWEIVYHEKFVFPD